jgi:hypothetical protein
MFQIMQAIRLAQTYADEFMKECIYYFKNGYKNSSHLRQMGVSYVQISEGSLGCTSLYAGLIYDVTNHPVFLKVCDRADRLRDTLIHEMCHAAVWVLNGVKNGHGRPWNAWYVHTLLTVFCL